MSIIQINHNPSRRELTVFGVIWLLFFTAVGVVAWSRGGSRAVIFGVAAAAVVVPLIGWIAPGFMRMVYLAMAYLAFPIGFIVSHLLLAGVYYLVLTPTGLLMRALGHDPMGRHRDAGAQSYWVPRKAGDDAERYFRQF